MLEEALIDWERRFTAVEMDRISVGFRPRDMDDKWLVFQEGNWIYCHRSWTGLCVYKLLVKDGRITKVFRNADQQETGSTARDEDSMLLDFIFNQLLLGKSVRRDAHSLEEHVILGNGSHDLYQRKPLDPELASIELSERPIQECKAELLGYGAKDTGEMGGGASLALSLAGGPQLAEMATVALTATNKQIGDVAFTSSLKLEREGVLALAHIVSINKHTPEGAWCPRPELLDNGVQRALEFARNVQLHSVAFSALGTGEGRVSPSDSARYMFAAIYRYRMENPDWPLAVTISLPTPVDFQAFQQVQREFR